MKNKTEIEVRLDKLESYVSEETEAIRKLSIQNKTKNLFDITSYEEVCKELGEKEETCPYKKVKQVEKLFNGNWEKDWNDQSQRKYYPCFKFENGSAVFLVSGGYSYGFDGSVGLYKNEKTSNHIGKHFIDIYKEIALS